VGKWASRLAVVALAPMILLLVAGCDDVNKIKQENQDLKAGNAALQQRLDQANADKAALEADKARLQADLAAKMAALDEMGRIKPIVPPVAPPPMKVDTAPKVPDDFGDADVTRTANAITVNVAGDVLFPSGKAALRPEALGTLDKIAKVIKGKYGANKLRVVGHTDGDPIKKSGWKDNFELSMARAKAVGDYLIRQGVAAANMEITGLANTDPRVPEKTTADKSKNRRVVVQVLLKS
jgi:flagellar motor protein MotB